MKISKSIVVCIVVGSFLAIISSLLVVYHIPSREDRSKERLANAVASGIESLLPDRRNTSDSRSAVDIVAEGAAETLDRLLPEPRHEESEENGSGDGRRDVIRDTLSDEGKRVVDDAADTIREADSPADLLNFGARVLDSASRTVGRVAPTVSEVTQEDLNRAGERIHDNIRANYRIQAVIPSGEDRISKVWRRLLGDGIREMKNPLRLYIIDAEPFNAFAHAGGYIYVNHGLLNKVNSEGELAFVLAHEIAHIDLDHVNSVVSIMNSSSAAGESGKRIAVVAYRLLSTGYSKEQEFEADREGLRMALAAGYQKEKCLRIFKHLKKPSRTTASQISSGAGLDPIHKIFQHFATHPDPDIRRRELAK